MPFAVCRVPVAPLRAEPAHKSEMISQLLLAEAGQVLEETKDFVKIQCIHDGYEGWCQRSQLVFTDEWTSNGQSNKYTTDWLNTVSINEVPAYIPMGIPVMDTANAQRIS